ncbi:ABC transporter permease [Catellatospora methionotrophica]|uniref:ABC transporter permease n=1 Tax=Catellatospora methionotrophica TaxID=121620 RepID=UPI00340EA903
MTVTAPARDTTAVATASHSPVPLWRLTVVELRKMADTRSGAWLLATVALLAVAVVTVLSLTADAQFDFGGLLGPTVLPAAVLLPVLGVLSITSEWSQRATLTTYALVPRRMRVAAAKVLAALALAVLAYAACLLATAAALPFAGGPDPWHLPAAALGKAGLFLVVNVLLGVAFGMVLLNSALAIVLYFVLPIAWSILGEMVTALSGPAQWLDLSVTSGLLLEPVMTGRDWARLGTSVAVWIVLPLVLGLIRVARREVK